MKEASPFFVHKKRISGQVFTIKINLILKSYIFWEVISNSTDRGVSVVGKTLVVYYSRTGTSRQVASALAEAFGAELEEIQPVANMNGVLGAVRGILDTVGGKEPLIVVGKKTDGYDRAVLVAPIWAGRVAAPAYTWLCRQSGSLKEVEVVTVSASEEADKTHDLLRRMTALKVKPVLHVWNARLRKDGAERVITKLLD